MYAISVYFGEPWQKKHVFFLERVNTIFFVTTLADRLRSVCYKKNFFRKKIGVSLLFLVKYGMSIRQRVDLNDKNLMTDIFHNLVIW